MISYYYNDITTEDGSHDIHTRICPHLSNRNVEIGIYYNAEDAIFAAHKGLPRKKFNCCEFCCRENLLIAT